MIFKLGHYTNHFPISISYKRNRSKFSSLWNDSHLHLFSTMDLKKISTPLLRFEIFDSLIKWNFTNIIYYGGDHLCSYASIIFEKLESQDNIGIHMFQFWLFFSRCYPENIEGNKLNSIYINVDFLKDFHVFLISIPIFSQYFLKRIVIYYQVNTFSSLYHDVFVISATLGLCT